MGRATSRRRIRVTGTVQGVGYRPFVYRHATELGLVGWVRNDSHGVLVEVEGDRASVAELCRRLTDHSPPLARVTDVRSTDLATLGDGVDHGFRIEASDGDGRPTVAVGVDTATCAACLAEVDDPTDRRHRYPFTNCTDCGPRYTIVRAVPYDRPTTTMAAFTMCADCQREYDDPSDRRFHAQPNACPACGPTLLWRRPDGAVLATGDDALTAAVAALGEGRILAVKGLGGYHLAADATSAGAVAQLRRRKARDDKPFAVMVADLAAAGRLCQLDGPADAALRSPRRPIVLAPRRPGAEVADGVAPGLAELGLMLAYTPLHHLLVGASGRPLVMTSGNHSDEPIAHTDEDAVGRLGPLVDGLLTHDRDIHIRCDDSVVRGAGGPVRVLRRSRGYAPEPLAVPAGWTAGPVVLAVGAELKSTVAVATGGAVVASHHLGDLEHLATYEAFLQAVDHLCHITGVTPEVVAHDLHPEYLSTKFAADLDLPARPVQHHHAHIASCLAEHGRSGPVLGLAFDGLGMGDDGTLWGGEILVADLAGYERVGHLCPVVLPGGTAAIREPWRTAVSWVHRSLGEATARRVGRRFDDRADAVVGLVERGQGPVTTSMGRLFDAVAALVGLRRRVSYEGQAAIELEALARTIGADPVPRYPMEIKGAAAVSGSVEQAAAVLDPGPLIAAVVADVEQGAAPAVVAAGFHRAVGLGAADLAVQLAGRRGLDTVALSGGVFQNALLGGIVADRLRDAGLAVLVHERVPPNDGGISIGQAVIAAHP